jgi:hypothetical protein
MVVLCLSNAALMIAVGLLGEYIAKIFEEGKGRPLYVVADTWNFKQPTGREAPEVPGQTTTRGERVFVPSAEGLGNPIADELKMLR